MKAISQEHQLQWAYPEDDETDGACIDRLERKEQTAQSPRSPLSCTYQQSQRKVSFNSIVTCVGIPHIDDLAKDTIDAVWLNNEELRYIKDMATEMAKFMSDNGEQVVDDTDEYCFRGLEYRTLEGNRSSRRNKNIVRSAVILQQQFVEGNPRTLAFASLHNSLVSREEAVERAKLDEIFAQQYYLAQ